MQTDVSTEEEPGHRDGGGMGTCGSEATSNLQRHSDCPADWCKCDCRSLSPEKERGAGSSQSERRRRESLLDFTSSSVKSRS
ncbi:hypothetical protein F2P81_003351 [Scophthalmus maximus]|uniref:Uncharacterized protein n=1 Tax=Scophthalmus maximus TaxID=52904 RepID=A0A6A4TE05_SCOMX|nr:hypothetical protein F2P81_003351 [Scophthalmus maximus]